MYKWYNTIVILFLLTTFQQKKSKESESLESTSKSLIITETGSQGLFPPVNPNATVGAKKLLNYLYSISGKNILSGHHNYADGLTLYTEKLEAMVQETPAIWGTDISLHRGDLRDSIVHEVINQHEAGSIITLMWHAGRPFDGYMYDFTESVKGEVTDEEWKDIVTPGTELHGKWREKVDNLAFTLKQIEEANIPILWRPYHEMNGMWFWWGDKKGEEGFVKLWKLLYKRLTVHHKINNLIWVWNANAPRDRENDEAYAYELYYPGNEYVDVLAADVYHNDYKKSHHDELVELGKGKPIALGEVGTVPTPEILKEQPMWTWFMIWARFVNDDNTPEGIQDLYKYESTLNRSEIERPY